MVGQWACPCVYFFSFSRNVYSWLCICVVVVRLTHKQTNKTPLRLYQDRQPIGPVDIVETAAIASQIHCLADRRDVLLFVSVYGVPPASSIVSSKPPAFCFIFFLSFFSYLNVQFFAMFSHKIVNSLLSRYFFSFLFFLQFQFIFLIANRISRFTTFESFLLEKKVDNFILSTNEIEIFKRVFVTKMGNLFRKLWECFALVIIWDVFL